LAREPKEIHSANYDGPERRVTIPARRSTDVVATNLKLFAVVLGIALTIFSAGGGYMAAKLTIDGKVGQQEWAEKNASQDHDREVMTNRQDRLEELIIKRVIPQLDKMENRLAAIYCAGKPPGCQ
jgi:hypothetical protein